MLLASRNLNAILFWVSLFVFAFWLYGVSFNVYNFKLVGILFELLWLPMVLLIGVLPIWAFIKWRKEHFTLRSFNAATLLVAVLTVVLICLA